MSILITGAAGFIGSNFIRNQAKKLNEEIHVLDSLTYAGNLKNIHDEIRNGNVIFIKGDITDSSFLFDLFNKYKFTKIIHFAAESHVDRSIEGSRQFIDTNIIGTFNLLEAARITWKGSSKNLFLHISTDEVFGELEDSDPAFSPTSSYSPRSPYSASKAASDHLVRAWGTTYDLPYVITNCSNNYGPFQFPEKLIPLMILNGLEKKPLPVYGDGKQIRDWIYVDDHCEGILSALNNGKIGSTYLFGGNTEIQNIKVVKSICSILDTLSNEGTKHEELITFVKDRPGHDRRYAIDTTYAFEELGWKPQHDFESALESTITWYIEHTDWANEVRSGEYQRFYEYNYSI